MLSSDINIQQLIELKAAMQHAQENTQMMRENITAFERRLQDLDENLRPVYDETILLTRARKNIIRTLLVLEKMTEYFKVADEVDSMLEKVDKEETLYSSFHNAVERLSVARAFFDDHRDVKASANALTKVNLSLEKSMRFFEKELKKLLSSYGSLIEFSNDTFKPSPSKLAKFDVQKIISIAQCIGTVTENFHYRVYGDFRTAHLQKDIRKQFEVYYSKHALHGAERNVSGPVYAVPWSNLFLTVPYSQGFHPFSIYYSIVTAAIKGEHEFWAVTMKVCRNKVLDDWWRNSGDDAISPEERQAELRQSLVVQEQEAHTAFSTLCEALINDMEAKLEPLLSTASMTENTTFFQRLGLTKGHTTQELAGSALRQSNILFIRLDILSVYLSQFSAMRDLCILSRRENEASRTLMNIRDSIITACIDSINNFIATASRDNVKDVLPSSIDGKDDSETVSGDDFNTCDMSLNTGHVISFTREIVKYKTVFVDLIEIAESVGLAIPEDTPHSVQEFTNLVHSALMKSLDARYSRFDSGKKRSTQVTTAHSLFSAGVPEANERLRTGCKHLYMANNICPLYQMLMESEGMCDGTVTGEDTENWEMMREREFFRAQQKLVSSLETRLKYESTRFVDVIVDSTGLIDALDECEAAGGPAVLETGHDKGKLLKSKFSIFNATMEAWTSHQGEWRISNEFLRESIKKDLVRKIMPMYTEFYDVYHQIRFSKKHMDQYLKFPPEDVERIIQGFFR